MIIVEKVLVVMVMMVVEVMVEVVVVCFSGVCLKQFKPRYIVLIWKGFSEMHQNIN